MDRREFLKWGSFLTVTVATGGLSACGGGDSEPDTGNPENFNFVHGVASGDPRPDSVVVWTRVEGGNGKRPVVVRLQVSTQPDFPPPSLLVNQPLMALPDWDYTIRNKVTGLSPGTRYYYRFLLGNRPSTVGRTRTAAAAGTPLSQLRFAFVSCQDWNANHWAGMEELAQQDLDFIVHVGDYIYEAVPGGSRAGNVEDRHGVLQLPNGTALPDGSVYATTLDDYRYLYRSYRNDARLQALHAAFPMIAIWDDHEFSDNCWQDRQTYDSDDDLTPRTARRRAANQAWFEFMPADVSLDVNNPSFQNIQIYRSFTFGNLATLLMTDERLYRADHIISEQSTGRAVGALYFVPAATLAAAEAQKIAAAGNTLTPVSMLGDAQRAWWQDRVGADATTWKLWANQVSLLRMQVDVIQAVARLIARALVLANNALSSLENAIANALADDLRAAKAAGTYANLAYTALRNVLAQVGIGSAAFDANIKPLIESRLPAIALLDRFILNADQWDGYNAERKNLMAFLKNNSVRNVVALSGDIHAFFAGQVMDDYDAATPAPVMVDLVTSGLSSNTLLSSFRSIVDNDQAFAALRELVYSNVGGTVVNTFDATLRAFNAWLRHADSNVEGYALVTLTPQKLSCTFHTLKLLEGSTAPAQPATASTRLLEVAAGTADVSVT
ncbi:alkaline phosphatase PhoD [Cupriavidus necator N-1]|uniref:Alkaline phosphatase PhoD n=1 Tax=Cupriavidus necator (strain ATCC 43291 / DSM 13513 / CCUG 52238 / LMG 8453 / N-1) TaxID=1042878 RepID=F8GSC6_CUPNN|nr:alkaline phosphatase D family protein [Cupriavidus necator]AEI79776.1 alkaline phosphatase PhoD [Cupriavidus necator N-1]MDX6010594.1 alkaline phosphatase D family protein [Cupriavidus necator]